MEAGKTLVSRTAVKLLHFGISAQPLVLKRGELQASKTREDGMMEEMFLQRGKNDGG